MSSTLLLVLLSLVGSSLAARLPYIIGGNKVIFIQFWPWMGSLHTQTGDFVCACSLISSEWAITAASCVGSPPFLVRFGSISRSDLSIIEPVLEVIAHEDYSTSGDYRYNDVALLRFSALDLTENVKPIPLGATEEAGNDNCHILGWGQLTSSDTTKPDILHEAKVLVTANTICDNDWGNINDGHVCTLDGSTRSRTCVGDTGGPLVCSHEDGKFELVGITSWQGSACSATLHPVYTRVSYYRQWIILKTRSAPSKQDIPE